MAAAAEFDTTDLRTGAVAHPPSLCSNKQQQLRFRTGLTGHQPQLQSYSLLALMLLWLSSPTSSSTTGNYPGNTLRSTVVLPHLSTGVALVLRGGSGSSCSETCASGSAIRVGRNPPSASVRRHLAFAHGISPFMRTGWQSEVPAAAVACTRYDTCDKCCSWTGSHLGTAVLISSNISSMNSKQPSSSSCYAYRLTFGKEEETGRVALVTGASRGIGKTIAETLAEAGVSHILCVAKNQAACDEVASNLVARGLSASGHGVDVADGAAVEKLCNTLLEKHPRIDILVNNAGITKDNLFIRMTPQDWIDVINVNLNSAFYFTSPLIKRMVKNRFGRIINMSSVVGVGGNVGQANYAASKAGLIGMTRSLGKEYANRGITVNAVAPGFIRSAMTDGMTEAAKAATLATIPAGRMGDPQDVANMVAYLASDQAAYVTGKVMPVDGGMLFGAN